MYYFLIPISIVAYKYRTNLGYYIMRSYSYLEILYEQCYKHFNVYTDHKLYVNGELVSNESEIKNHLHGVDAEDENIFEIEFNHNNRKYRIVGRDLEKLIAYVENIELNVEKVNKNPNNIYKWISATDHNGNDCLEIVKKYSGPLGDFYKHIDLEIKTHHLDWVKDKKINLVDFRLDEYTLDGTHHENTVNLEL